MPLTTSSMMFFPRSLDVSGLSTSYTFTRVIQLVLISHQFIVRESNSSKKKKKDHKKNQAEHPIISNV